MKRKPIAFDDGKPVYFECCCSSDEHTLKFTLLDNAEGKQSDEQYPGDVELYTHVYMNEYKGIFGRIWTAIKYVLGYRCKYGHWDCFLLKLEDADRFIEILENFKSIAAQYEKEVSAVASREISDA